jgi:dihydroorotase
MEPFHAGDTVGEFGFLSIVGHGVPQSLIDGASAANAQVFAQRMRTAATLALADGTIDMLDADQAPHAPAATAGGMIWDIARSFPGVESSLVPMLTGIAAGRLSLQRLVQIISAAPARVFGIAGRKVSIAPGADADLVMADLSAARRSRLSVCSRAASSLPARE